MKIGLFSDVHGNLAALQAVMADLSRHGGLTATVCAGDMVFLGPSPGEVLDLLEAEQVQMLRGNADDMVTGLLPPESPPNPRVATLLASHIHWNRRQLSGQQVERLRSLPLTLAFGSLLVCHASPLSNADGFPRVHEHTADTLREVYARPGVQAVAYGHWHQPGVTPLGDVALVNVSSVSIPMDGQVRARYAIAEWHQGFWRFEHHCVPYDIAPELARMREREMPEPPWPKGPANG